MSHVRNVLLALCLVEGCGGGTSTPADDDSGPPPTDEAGTADAATSDDLGAPATDGPATDDTGAADGPASPGDSDGDGISDADEAKYADLYVPFLSIHPQDSCPTHGLLLRISPHPKEPKRVMMWVDVLYNEDCGALGHAGDDEVFGAVIDPSKPAPDGIVAVRAISHQGTPCEHTTTCGSCKGMTACSTGTKDGKAYPAVFPSKDKHGNYGDLATCTGSFLCDSGGCALAPQSADAPKVNAGEPTHPLVHDLTSQGFITAANGWTKTELLNFDPWKAGKFGGAGDVSQDLVDTSFVIDTTACP
jgi:hypothetical protein